MGTAPVKRPSETARYLRGGTDMSIIELQGLEVPAESAEALGSTISNSC
ncbi:MULTISPECIES: hypothetical protein [unclassified Streptomyces]|nr:hypothetical protein [Streptomyces sp. sk2.1]